MALAWQILLLTRSATAMGIVMTAEMIPRLLFLLLGGVAADRLPKRLVMLCSDAGRAIVVLVIALSGWFHLLQFWHLVILALFFGIVEGFFSPAYRALPPQLVKTEDLTSANALTGLSEQKPGRRRALPSSAVFLTGNKSRTSDIPPTLGAKARRRWSTQVHSSRVERTR